MAGTKQTAAPKTKASKRNASAAPSTTVKRHKPSDSTASEAAPTRKKKRRVFPVTLASTRARRTRKMHPTLVVPLLELPGELRNMVYIHAGAGKTVYISDRKPHNLVCHSELNPANSQVRGESLDAMLMHSERVVANVINFDFRHVITCLLNRLSDRELKALTKQKKGQPAKRKLELRLRVSRRPPWNANQLWRWFNQLHHLKSKGISIKTIYTVPKPVFRDSIIEEWVEFIASRWSEVEGGKAAKESLWLTVALNDALKDPFELEYLFDVFIEIFSLTEESSLLPGFEWYGGG